jgi:hypothetical protein
VTDLCCCCRWCAIILKGDIRAKKFDIVHVIRGRGQRVIASVKKESKFKNSTAFLM